jgi:hypothetical protein
MRAESTTSPTVKAGDSAVRFAMFGAPALAGGFEEITLNQTKKDNDAIKHGISLGLKKFAAAVDKTEGNSPACKQYHGLSKDFCDLPDEIEITDRSMLYMQ